MRQALSDAADSREALAVVFHARKRERPSWSLASLCRKAGIPSKGYLSQVVNGRKLLSAKHVEGIVAALELEVAEERLVRALLARDHGKDPGDATIDGLRKALRVNTIAALEAHGERLDVYFAFEVFCAIGLFASRATLQQLTGYFGEHSAHAVTVALRRLATWGLVGEQDGAFVPLKEQVIFGGSDDGLTHIGFLRAALRDAEQRLTQWFKKPNEAYIDSIILSVEESRYQEVLTRLKADMRRYQSELEAKDANLLVRFNVQIYPSR